MELNHIRIQDFRNIEFADLPLEARRHFFLGKNAQGKSNLLEALGLATALRSFRVNDLRPLTRSGTGGWGIHFSIINADKTESTLELRVEGTRKQIRIDGEPVRRLGELLGRFPAVVLASEDLNLVRGSPGDRRRWIDLVVSLVSREYFEALSQYNQALLGRNRLLKGNATDQHLEAFEVPLAEHAAALYRIRRAELARLTERAVEVYGIIAEGGETPLLAYAPQMEIPTPEDYRECLLRHRSRDRALGATRDGPHRDDIAITVDGRPAREFGSDGQQRALVLALRLAQARYLETALQTAPILLADDVLGELDPRRREGFWRACGDRYQLFVSGTEPPPPSETWRIWHVAVGKFT